MPPATPTTGLRQLPLLATAAVVLVFALLVATVSVSLRKDLRAQVLAREAEALLAVVRLQQGLAEDEWRALGIPQPPDDRFSSLLLTTRLRGVLALRLFDPSGELRDALPVVAAASARLDPTDQARVARGDAFARLLAAAPADVGLAAGEGAGATLLEVLVPLAAADAAAGGTAQYLIDGAAVRAEFRTIDRGLLVLGGGVALGGGTLVALLLAWTFRRLAAARVELEAQREDLARANRELLLAAKTSAVGAIASHLIHGLNNPLAGLEGFVRAGAEGPPDSEAGAGLAWREAAETTGRVRALVNEVIAVLREESAPVDTAVAASDVLQAVHGRLRADAAAAGVRLACSPCPGAELSGRAANLAGLVLRNLVTNALEASRPGTTITLKVTVDTRTAAFHVADEGAGLPESVRQALFRPQISRKPGGGGIGLALSHQLARHAGGSLELVRTSAAGTEFRLVLPAAATNGSTR
jgi:signal transduction histidine kinase